MLVKIPPDMTQENLVKICKALSDKSRIQILAHLKKSEICACHLVDGLSIPQSTLAHHMKILCEAGLVIPRKEGRWMYYSISQEAGQQLAQGILSLTQAD